MVPADKKWFARLVVAAAVYEALAKLRLRYPDVGPEKKKELAAARAELMRETKPAGPRKSKKRKAGSGASKKPPAADRASAAPDPEASPTGAGGAADLG